MVQAVSPLRTNPSLIVLVLAISWPARSEAAVLFQNTGVKAGWTSLGIQHQGKIDEVTTPSFSGPTALRMEQTFMGFSGYHSEVRLHEAQGPVGSDVYYGMALYLPPNWVFHGQNVTFQQWARGDVFASPWVLMYVENDEIRTGGSGGVRGVMAKITGMQGKWIRVVTHLRHHPTNGLFEVWVNGVKGFTFTGKVSPAAEAPIRWSAGMYCTRWREEQPAGLNPMVLFQDHYRVATTYDEADPMNWKDGAGPPPVVVDAGAVDSGAGGQGGGPEDAGEGSPDVVTGTAKPDAGADQAAARPMDARPRPAPTTDPPEEEPEPVPPARPAPKTGGCHVGGGGRGGALALLLVLFALGFGARRVRTST
jgi:hypothetical protein